MYSPEENSKLATMRAKAAAGSLTEADLKEAVVILRQARLSAVKAAGGRKARTPSKDGDALLAELEGV